MNDNMLDFYFSAKHLAWQMEISIYPFRRRNLYFRGTQYTECTKHKIQALSAAIYDDLVFCGTGTLEDIEIK